MDVDVAIVGAGPAGLYVAWRLVQHPSFKSQSICLFDAADRIGGRVASVCVPGIPFVADLGAMRYLPSQILVKMLISHLELPSAEFKFDTSFYSLRGQLLSSDIFNGPEQEQLPYRVGQGERSKDPFQLIAFAIRKALANLEFDSTTEEFYEDGAVNPQLLRSQLRRLMYPTSLKTPFSLETLKPEQWRFIKRFGTIDGERLYNIGFWDLLQDNLSTEGYSLAHDGGGYQSIFSMWNAAEAIIWFLADFSTTNYETIIGGMRRLTDNLYDQFEMFSKENDRSINESNICKLEWTLTSITVEKDEHQKQLLLKFVSTESLEKDPEPSYQMVKARKVILALPQPALKSLHINGLGSKDVETVALKQFHSLLDTVTANPLFKLFLVYDRPWWTELPGGKDFSFKVNTDQPLRQIYHFGPNRQYPVPDQNSEAVNYRLVMASYSDARYAEYWKKLHDIGMRDEKPYFPDKCKAIAREELLELEKILKKYGTTSMVVRRAQEQLQRVYSVESLPEPITLPEPIIGLFQHWSTRPYYAGWHSWNMGTKAWSSAAALVQPFTNFPIYTCGEAFSSEQGWIEGALKSAERVLEKLGLSEPPWLRGKARDEYHSQKVLWL